MFVVAIPCLGALPAAAAAPAEGSRRPALLAARGGNAAAMEAARRFLCPHGGAPVRGQRGRCRASPGGGPGGDISVLGWQAGLAPPSTQQTPCPEGTVAVRPVARSDAMRCLPR